VEINKDRTLRPFERRRPGRRRACPGKAMWPLVRTPLAS
jgi:hypothetical protein